MQQSLFPSHFISENIDVNDSYNQRSRSVRPWITVCCSVFTAPDLVACWCDVHGPALHSASCGLGGRVSVLGDGQPRGRRALRGHQGGLALFAPFPIGADMAVAQSPRAGHVLRDAVICGHVYGPMQRGTVLQLQGPQENRN